MRNKNKVLLPGPVVIAQEKRKTDDEANIKQNDVNSIAMISQPKIKTSSQRSHQP